MTMATQCCNTSNPDSDSNSNSNSNACSSSIVTAATTTTPPDGPWKKLSETQNIQLPMDSVIDASSWPALSSKRVSSPPEVIIPESSSLSAAIEIAAGNDYANESSATIDSKVSVSVSVSVSIDRSDSGSEQDKLISMSSSSTSSTPSSSRGTNSRPFQNQSPRQYNFGHNQNQHYPSGHFGSNQRGNGFNAKGGNRGGNGFPNQSFSNRRHQQRGFNNNWSHNRGAQPRFVNSQQHGFGNGPSGFLGPPPLPHSYPYSTPTPTPMVNTTYLNVNVNHPPPPAPAPVPGPGYAPGPVPGYILPYGYYGNPYFSEASNQLYYPSVPSVPLPSPPPPPPPYMDAISGTPTNNQPILLNPEVGLCNTILYQIEYYFSKENLVKDAYLKSLMDNEGWVSIHVIAGFRRHQVLSDPSSSWFPQDSWSSQARSIW
ncbi:la-related protein 1C-like isoform X2 [Macadamia integrifolia]|uniref:la-related protein 1C-like isoform X2 n=1 Tax=Macadamia integrifolia TaxID=60698 RepID=UPI001C4FF7D8|nr:la-related protein 1C-like isoform X2 [Macadamia integrifolia]